MFGGREGPMRIGQISKHAGLSVDAIRFYERNGLLAAPARSQGGFRLYSAADLSTLEFIHNLQTLGFSLAEIREFLALRTNDLRACSEVRKKLDRKLKDIHAKRTALVKLEQELKAALKSATPNSSAHEERMFPAPSWLLPENLSKWVWHEN